MSDRQICGECKWHKYITNVNYDFMGYSTEEWICDNEKSDAYSLLTNYTDTCECFEQNRALYRKLKQKLKTQMKTRMSFQFLTE